MPSNRYYLPHPFVQGKSHTLSGDEFHHLSRVMRKQVGHFIELVNGHRELALAHIDALTSKEATLTLTKVTTQKPALPPLILLQSFLPLPQLKLITQKATELGVSHIAFFPAARSEKKSPSPSTLSRLTQVTIAAMKQCGRLDLPTLSILSSLREISLTTDVLFFGDLRDSAPYLHTVLSHGSSAIAIGPEKGFSPEEISFLETRYQARGIKLHPYTLRAETAAIAALACLSHFQSGVF